MTYPYTVKVNGKWYPANTEIPDVEKAEVLDEEKAEVLDEEKTSEGTGEVMTGIETENGETAESEAEKEAPKKKTGAKK